MTRPNSEASPKLMRIPTHVAPKLDKHLLAYAAAASAAGVTLLAVTPSAEAKIVYTSANITIPGNTQVPLDVNNDGMPDFVFSFYTYGPRKAPLGHYVDALELVPSKTGNEVWQVPDSRVGECAAALPRGTKVGTNATFVAQPALLWDSTGTAYSGPYTFCKFGNLPHGAYLGLRFVVNGQTHYGWAHVTVNRTSAVLNGYAYETVPNQSIATGKTNGPVAATTSSLAPLPVTQPATLGLLAQGSRGLALWRRTEDERLID
jgi:hypothetical protein